MRNLYQEIRWCIKIHPKTKTCKRDKNQNQAISSPNRISWTHTNTDIPIIPSCSNRQMEEEEEGCEGVPISVSIYSGARDSMRSEYVSVPSRSPSAESSHYQVHVEHYSSQNEVGDLPETKLPEIRTQKVKNGVIKNRVPITCSWPSIEGQVSVNTPSIGSTQTAGSDIKNSGYSEPYSNKRLSTACDSGYSELDICSVGNEYKEILPGIEEKFSQFSIEAKCIEPIQFEEKSEKETQTVFLDNEPIFPSCIGTVLDDLELCFHLDKLVEISDEEKYFQEIEDKSSYSDYSRKCSCSESESLPAQLLKQSSFESFQSQPPLTQFTPKPVTAAAQFNSLRTIQNFHTHNVSKKYLESLQQENFNSLPPLKIVEKGKSLLSVNGQFLPDQIYDA